VWEGLGLRARLDTSLDVVERREKLLELARRPLRSIRPSSSVDEPTSGVRPVDKHAIMEVLVTDATGLGRARQSFRSR